MSQKGIDASFFSPDTRQFLDLLFEHEVKYLIVGGQAVIYYGHARLTGDVDFFFGTRQRNIEKLYAALNEFWGGNIPGIERVEELGEDDLILQFGVPPNRIDLVSRIDGVTFEEAWADRNDVSMKIDGRTIVVHLIGLEALIRNKEAVGRPKDASDLEFLRTAGGR